MLDHDTQSIANDLLQFGPVKFFTVKSGTVRVCYLNGRVRIYKEGKY